MPSNVIFLLSLTILAVICQDLQVLDDTVSDTSDTHPGWISWSKMDFIGSRLSDITRFGYVHYNFESVSSIQKAIKLGERWTDPDICYEIALLRLQSAHLP